MEKKPIIDWTLLGATAARSPPGWDPAGAGGGGTANPEINSQKADVWVWGNAGVVQGRSRGGASPGDSSGAGLPGPGGGRMDPPHLSTPLSLPPLLPRALPPPVSPRSPATRLPRRERREEPATPALPRERGN